MSHSRWQTVSQIFEAALDLPASERDDFVRQACGGNVELESEVVSLLAADQNAGSFLERPAVSTLPVQTLSATPPLLPAGCVVASRFKIIRFIGQGGMGQVYHAVDLELNSQIALKVIRPEIASDPRMLSRFRREVQLTRIITHPSVCRTFDIERHVSASTAEFGSDAGNLTFLTMELLEGETLTTRLRRQERLTSAEALPLVLQMIDALAAAHAAGVIHRDFKPSNVLLVPSGNPALRVVVTDFGLARAFTADPEAPRHSASMATSLTGDQPLMGTLIYMAPEQFERGETSVASDIYSLGLVMFEMVSGQRPFADKIPFAEATKRLKQPAPAVTSIVPDLDTAWDAAISHCLALEPKGRFENVRHVADALVDPAAAYSDSTLRAASLEPKTRTAAHSALLKTNHTRRRKILATVAIVALVVSLSALAFRHYKWKAEVPEGASILVTEVANQTSDQELNATTDLLLHELSQSAHFGVIERSKIRSVLTQMGKPYQQRLDPPDAREVALRSGGSLVAYGSITQLGPALSLDLRLERLGASPSAIPKSWNRSFQANDKQDLFHAVKDGSQWIRSMAGENVDSFAKEKPPQDTTTSSWEALLLYSQAEHVKSLDDTLGAIELLKKAVAVDPDFALAWMRLGDLSNSIKMDGDALRYWQKALETMTKRPLTQREELRIKGLYADDSGDYATSARVFQEWEVLYPRDYLPSFYLAGALRGAGRYKEAIDKLDEAEKKEPNAWYIAAQRAHYNLATGKYDRIASDVKRLRELGATETVEMLEGALDFVRNDYDSAFVHLSAISNSSNDYWKSLSYSVIASFLSERGQYEAAKALLHKGVEFDSAKNRAGSVADEEIELAYLAFRNGDRSECRRASLAAAGREDGPVHLKVAGSMLARCGFPSEANRFEQLLQSLPNTPVFQIAKHRIAGELLLFKGQSGGAVVAFQAEASLENDYVPKEYLARALAAAGKQEEALKLYRQIVDTPGQIWQEPDVELPGLWGDALFQSGRLGCTLQRGKLDFLEYAKLRQPADSQLKELAHVSRECLAAFPGENSMQSTQ